MCLFVQTKWNSSILLRVKEGKAKQNMAFENMLVPCGVHRILSASGQNPSNVPTHRQPAGDGNSWGLVGGAGSERERRKETEGEEESGEEEL